MIEEVFDARYLFNRNLVVKHWDNTTDQIQVIQLHGTRWDRYMDGAVTVQYEDGQQQYWDLKDLVSSVVAEEHPNKYEYMGEPFNESVLMIHAHRSELRMRL